MIQLVVFDMAGTTVDEQNLVYKMVHAAIEQAGFSVSFEDVLLHGAGKAKLQAIQDILSLKYGASLAEAEALSIHQNFKVLLKQAYQVYQAKPQPGAPQIFEELRARGIKVVLNTGYNRETAEHLLNQLGWVPGLEIDQCITADDVERGRPHPDMILQAMTQFYLDDARMVAKIGDSIIDIEEGLAAGCSIVAGITTGAQTEDQLQQANPTHIIHHLEELLPIIDGN